MSDLLTIGNVSEAGVYDVSVSEDDMDEMALYEQGLSESVPKDAPESDFARPPKGLYVGDAKHAALAVQAVTSGLEGNKAKGVDGGVKAKIASAVRKFYSGDMQKYYLTWLHTGKKPERPTSEATKTHVEEMRISAPNYSMTEEPLFPDVPIAPGVDFGLLTSGDAEPVVIVRPLAILDEVSQNGLVYNSAVFNGIYNQVVTKRPAARRGHVPPDGKSSDFPPDDGYWIGAVIDSLYYGKPTVFGKCYVVPGPMRDMVLRRRAAGTSLSNSLYGDVTFADDVPIGVEIETIDFVPEERAALQALGGDFVVTSEMTNSSTEEPMDKKELHEAIQGISPDEVCEMLSEATRKVVAEAYLKQCKEGVYEMVGPHRKSVAEAFCKEATPEETYDMLPAGHRKAVAEAYCRESKQKMVPSDNDADDKKAAEMREMTISISEMQTQLKLYQRQDYERTLDDVVSSYFSDWTVKTPQGQEKLDALKKNLRVLTVAEMAGSTKVEDVAPAAVKAWDNVKPLAETTLATLAGPSLQQGVVIAGGAGQKKFGYDPNTGRYDDDYVAAVIRQTNAVGRAGNGGRA